LNKDEYKNLVSTSEVEDPDMDKFLKHDLSLEDYEKDLGKLTISDLRVMY